MPSPFPGMDPWLEGREVFPSVHDRLNVFLQDALNAALPPGYAAAINNRVWFDDDGDEQIRIPDVAISGRHPAGSGGVALAALGRAGLIAAAARRRLSEPRRETFLEVRADRGRRLVTAVEILSRSNKTPGDRGRTFYLQKQIEYQATSVNSVEIDLLRFGPYSSCFPRRRLPDAGSFDYHVSIAVRFGRDRWFLAPFRLVDRLPAVPIPLDADIEPVTVDLQPLFDRVYDGGRYPDAVDYAGPPEPPLPPEQLAWVEGRLRLAGLRPNEGGA